MFVVQNEDGMKAKKTDVVGEFGLRKKWTPPTQPS
jgi:hypothetical protein